MIRVNLFKDNLLLKYVVSCRYVLRGLKYILNKNIYFQKICDFY